MSRDNVNGQSGRVILNSTPDRSRVMGTSDSKTRRQVEVVPDSEEERIQMRQQGEVQATPIQVIEISSSEDEEPIKKRVISPASKPSTTKKKFPKARRIIESSESESEGEILVPGKKACGSDEGTPVALSKTKSIAQRRNEAIVVPQLPLYDEDDETADDLPLNPDAILVYDGSSKKPLRVDSTSLSRLMADVGGSASLPSTPTRARGRKEPILPPSGSPTKSSPSKRKPRMSKKAEKEARLAELLGYAQNFFHELNTLVFNDGIPSETVVRWNTKLYSTAGKARYNKSRNEGRGHSEIELAPKILEDEDGNMKENHGAGFKKWQTTFMVRGARVMKARPDIAVTTTHSYDISHPYRWQCLDCQLIYGRFSKSIKPDQSRCGTCGDKADHSKGILVPLHEERPRKSPQTPASKISRMAASKPRDSPSSIFSFTRKTPAVAPEPECLSEDEVEFICDASTATTANTCGAMDDSDSDIEFIAMKMSSASIRS
ncbi:hypothetical protein VNI00_014384 [Paramarasmius palmivorus]|uniref:SprT-like domain-containing protein n=1 Tax=Paramarasmius palmivorus TaxID=297713 RepID=A0AAW0BTQ9_9AGAR